MPSFWDDGAAEALVARVRRLTPDHQASWGRFSSAQAVVHLTDACLLYLGELPCVPKNSPIRYSPLKQLIIFVLPFPKSVPTAPELLARRPGDWQAEVDALCCRHRPRGRRASARDVARPSGLRHAVPARHGRPRLAPHRSSPAPVRRVERPPGLRAVRR